MEKTQTKPAKPKHRVNVNESELPPPPVAPQLSDFLVPQPEAEVKPDTSTVVEEQEPVDPVVEEFETNADHDKTEEEEEDCPSGTVQENKTIDSTKKTKEVQMSAVSYVQELPLDALLTPQVDGSKVNTSSSTFKAAKEHVALPLYPKLNEPSILPQIALNDNLVENTGVLSPQVKHKSIYPLIEDASAPLIQSESELLNEVQLLTYYQNEQLDFVDDFVDEFVTREFNPRNTLHNLLEKFASVCEQIQRNDDTKKTLSDTLRRVNNEVWLVEDRKVSKSGRCGDDKAASGETTYKKAELMSGKLAELNHHLTELTKCELDEGFILEIRARSLALQIQWIIVKLNQDFLIAHNLTISTIPTLTSPTPQDASCGELIGALSDLFYFLRFPMLSKRFADSLRLWVVELSSVLLKFCTPTNQMFLTAQILRLPSPIDWAVPLLQTYISTPCLDMSKSIDLFVALLSMILQPVYKRDEFLVEVKKYYEGDNGWNFIGEDGEENVDLTKLQDVDLIALLNQFDFKLLYLNVFQQFNARHQGNRLVTMLSAISFTLILLKILSEGLKTYSGMKDVCKKICEFIRKTVQYICSYWKCSASLFGSERHAIQNEINRIILQAVFYIVCQKSVGLWQFLVEFPFSIATDFCRMRCQILLRNPTNTSVAQLYEINDAKLEETLLSSRDGKLENCLERIGVEDRSYALSTISEIIASFDNVNVQALLNELLDICFFDEQHREQYLKVGPEALSVILDKKPQLLSHILKYIDRRMDHLDNSDIFSTTSLARCKLSEDEIGSLLGKWLINRPINHSASIIARRILSSLNWGATGDLFLPPSVHDVCAETIVKAHVVHCKNRNNLIAKSVAKATKLALKCPDLEQSFDKFCHDMLIRLKITEKPLANSPQTDLTAFYVYLIEKCLSSLDKFLIEGLSYWVELVNSACFNNAVVILIKLTEKFSPRIHLFTANESFRQTLERLLHADESYYAVQWFVGADKFPGPILRFISCAITNQLSGALDQPRLKQLISCWVSLLTCKKTSSWNEDKFVLHLLDIISRVAFTNDPVNSLDLVDNYVALYQGLYTAWTAAPKGMLGWFSSVVPPQLVSSSLMDTNPWFSYLALQAEPQIYSNFYVALYNNLAKHKNRTLDETVKRAASKSSICLSIERLDFYRWLSFCTKESLVTSEVYPLALQQLTIALFKRQAFAGRKFCPGGKYFQCKQAEPLFTELRDKTLPIAEKNATYQQSASFIRSAGQWIFNESIYAADFNDFNTSNINMDYLLQMIVSNDNHPWTEFVNIVLLQEQITEKSKLFASYCQLSHAILPVHRKFEVSCLTDFFRQLDVKDGFGRLIPEVPLHQNLPKCDYAIEDCLNIPAVVAGINLYLNKFVNMAKTFADSKDSIAQLNTAYYSEFRKLYNNSMTTLVVHLKCGNFLSQQCRRPGKVSVSVNASHYNVLVAQSMNDNRNKREGQVSKLLRSLDSVAIQSAQMEHFCWKLFAHSKMLQHSMPARFIKGPDGMIDQGHLQTVGVLLFYRLCANNQPELFLFPASTACFENCLFYLGQNFVRGNPNEQQNLLRMVLAGNPLNVYIIQNFTPHCVPADQLLSLYSELSTAVRTSSSTKASLALLERLDIDNSNNQLPPHHFSALMPIIFENMASVPASTKLHKLCVNHFEACMFYSFPNNFLQGLQLLLSGFDSRSVSASMLDTIVKRLKIDEFVSQTANNYNGQKAAISVEIARQSLGIITQQLVKSKTELGLNLFAVWLDYLEPVCQFADFFVRVIVNHDFMSDASQKVIETGLRQLFTCIISVWGPLLEPVGPSLLPPWNPSDKQVAETVVVRRLVDLLIWLPHSTYLPPGSESTEPLFWHVLIKKFLVIQKAGSSHVFAVYENQFSRLYWSRFWPNLLDLNAMEHAFEFSPDVGQFLTEVLIRIQWVQLLQQMENQPEDAHRAFYSLMLSILSRCVQNCNNFAKSRASVEKLIGDFFIMGKWHYVKVETVEKVASYIVTSFPNDSIVNPSGPMTAFYNIWREVCFFSVKRMAVIPPSSADLDPGLVAKKQACYIRAYVNLILHSSSIQNEEKLRLYKEVLDKCHLLIGAFEQNDETKTLVPIAEELIAFWPEVSKEKLAEGFFTTLVTWFNAHPDSILLLLLMNVAISSLGKRSPQTGLKLLDNCVSAYFTRRLNCNWDEVCKSIRIPDNMKEWLFTTPSSDTGNEARFLTLNAHLLKEMSQLSSAQEEEKLMRCLADYLDAVKPKYITNEVAFVVCLEKYQRMVVRQFANKISIAIANEQLEAYINYLRKITSEEKSVSLFNVRAIFGKKQMYPLKLQLLASIVSLFIVQQQTATNQLPRLKTEQPVMMSRISAFRDLQQVKAFQEIENLTTIFQLANLYFTQPESHNLNHAGALFYRVAVQLYPGSQKLLIHLEQ